MGPTSYCLRAILCSSSDVSRIVGNEIGLTTTPIECFHGDTNFLTRVVGKKNSKGLWVLTITLQDLCCVQAQ